MQIKNITDIANNEMVGSEPNEVMSDIRYICKSCSLITESLQKGCDVMQLSNGDIIITEMKPVTFQYSWDEKKGKLVRSQFGSKHRKLRVRQKRANSADSKKEAVEVRELETV